MALVGAFMESQIRINPENVSFIMGYRQTTENKRVYLGDLVWACVNKLSRGGTKIPVYSKMCAEQDGHIDRENSQQDETLEDITKRLTRKLEGG